MLVDLGHVVVVVGQLEFPDFEHGVEFPVAALPVFDVGEGRDVHGLLEELVDLGEDAQNFDVVAKGAEVLRLV